ncbi:unnamed protein product [Rotaria socialis]|uniref:Kelch domain-containing protein 10 n=1 Tax=Rotaria socialis TaxID=392032 RepID=A0A820U4C0_9BILA|nr:unnamed protein product [Rotaria socialis]
MTDDPTTNQKSSTESSEMNDSANTNRSKQPFRLSTKYISSINLMRFAEVSPLDNNNKPLPRSGHRAVATESDFWIWGGYFPSFNHQQQPMFNELWRFNYARREWTLETVEGDGPNLTLASHSMCLYRNLAFVFGGTGFPFGETVSNRLYILDLKRLQWKHCPIANQEPEQVYGASMLVHNDHLYILCGTNRWSYNTNVYDIHLPTLTCTQIGHTFDEIDEFNENGRYRQEVYLYDQKIFVFGGGGGSGISYSLENLPVFDIDNRRWSFVHTNPDPIHIIMFGGAHFDTVTSAHHTVSEHLWTFDFEKLEWSMLQSLNMVQSTYFHAAAMNSRGEIWTHGGVIQDSAAIPHETRITNLYKMHTRVLHLSEIAWNYFLNCLADRKSLLQQPEVLSRLNIPKRFVGRIH